MATNLPPPPPPRPRKTRRAGQPRPVTRRKREIEEEDDLFEGEVEEVESGGFFRDKKMLLMIAGGAGAGLVLFLLILVILSGGGSGSSGKTSRASRRPRKPKKPNEVLRLERQAADKLKEAERLERVLSQRLKTASREQKPPIWDELAQALDLARDARETLKKAEDIMKKRYPERVRYETVCDKISFWLTNDLHKEGKAFYEEGYALIQSTEEQMTEGRELTHEEKVQLRKTLQEGVTKIGKGTELFDKAYEIAQTYPDFDTRKYMKASKAAAMKIPELPEK
jgi:hypothetical protein